MKVRDLLQVTVCGVALCAIPYTAVKAQIAFDTQNQEAAAGNGEEGLAPIDDRVKVLVEVVRTSDNSLEARISNVTQAGVQIGMNKMILEADVIHSKLSNGSNAQALSFERASMVDENDGNVKRTNLGIPFSATIVPNPDVSPQDQFELEVSSSELLAAWQRLNAEENNPEDEDEEKEKTSGDEAEFKNSGGTADGTSDQPDFEGPSFAPAQEENIVTSTVSCGYRVDEEQEAAILQEKTIIDGVEGECTDTLTRIPLVNRNEDCPVLPNIETLTAEIQEKTGYTDPDSGNFVEVQGCSPSGTSIPITKLDTGCPDLIEFPNNAFKQFSSEYVHPVTGLTVQAQGCTPDRENPMAITETTDGCGLFHDFDVGTSFQQSKFTYTKDELTVTVQSCQNSDVSYAHIETTDGCAPVYVPGEGFATEQTRIKINIGAAEQFLTSCSPNSTTFAVQTEECTGGNRYTHDFVGGQSQVNETVFYIDSNDNRTNVSECQPGATSFEHVQETDGCTPVNDDTNKQTTMFGKTLIEDPDNGGLIQIQGCTAISPTVPYVLLENRYRIDTQFTSGVNVTGDDVYNFNGYSSAVMENVVQGNTPCNSDSAARLTCDAWSKHSTGSPITKANMPAFNKKVTMGNSTSLYGYQYCIRNELVNDWVIPGSIVLDKANSNASPTWTQSISGTASISTGGSPVTTYNGTVTFTCSQPQCDVTRLVANPVYQRGDLSEWRDTSVITTTKHVCGNGNNLDGQTAP